MEYNQYWNEIKGLEDDVEKRDNTTSDENVVSFSYNAVPEEPTVTKEYNNRDNNDSDAFFDEDEYESPENDNEEDDSTMYSNSSLFEMIDEMEEKEEAEKEERLDDARFINFDFKDDIEDSSEKDVHIFADEFGADIDDDEIEEPEIEESVVEEEPYEEEPAVEEVKEEVEEDVVQEVTEETVEEPTVEESVEEMPHFESPVFEDKEETDIDKLIIEAKKKEEEESSQQKLMDDADLLPLLKDIISFMPASCGFVDYILKLSNDDRKDLVRFIDQAKNAWLKDKSDKLFTIAEGELSICILSDVTDPMREVQRLETIGAQMFSYEKESWNVVKLYFDGEGRLLRADTSVVNKDCFNSWQWKIVQNAGYNLWKSRQ